MSASKDISSLLISSFIFLLASIPILIGFAAIKITAINKNKHVPITK
jgi:hypothetical protein